VTRCAIYGKNILVRPLFWNYTRNSSTTNKALEVHHFSLGSANVSCSSTTVYTSPSQQVTKYSSLSVSLVTWTIVPTNGKKKSSSKGETVTKSPDLNADILNLDVTFAIHTTKSIVVTQIVTAGTRLVLIYGEEGHTVTFCTSASKV